MDDISALSDDELYRRFVQLSDFQKKRFLTKLTHAQRKRVLTVYVNGLPLSALIEHLNGLSPDQRDKTVQHLSPDRVDEINAMLVAERDHEMTNYAMPHVDHGQTKPIKPKRSYSWAYTLLVPLFIIGGVSFFSNYESCETVAVPYTTVSQDDPTRYIGDDYITRGLDGKSKVCKKDGKITRQEVITKPTNAVRFVGSKVKVPVSTPTPTYTQPTVNNNVRTGAVCNDGTTSSATGRGACSHHGGVNYWTH
jgi:hypothetical protein